MSISFKTSFSPDREIQTNVTAPNIRRVGRCPARRHAAAVGDADGAARGGAAGAVGVCHVVACHVAITFSISRVQRANHAVFALCRGEKMSCNNAFLTACSMCSRNLFRPEGWSPWSDCPRGRRCSGSRRHRDGCVSSSCRTGHIRRPWESLRGRRWRQAARGCRNASA